MKKPLCILLFVIIIAVLAGCGKANDTAPSEATRDTVSVTEKPTVATEAPTQAATVAVTQSPTQMVDATEEPQEIPPTQAEEVQQEKVLEMKIAGTPVTVAWEDNDAVAALKEYCRDQILTIPLSMYGGFEQVGSIGTTLPQNDVQTTTQSGDIVLYSGNQIVVFYGSNSWAYTRLGHITDKSQDELTSLLSNGDVSITLEY
ncbi:cyclophilin-like fold protein [uncultured Ruminococcus sp.]|uniref:cyclophilin-like fold protein n=1 Tax=uncultured Ruminococcus sp. TaxID=165186 RepID=UPI00292D6410|nr:cyclophilin-like fold protein [uncultured Ruminococcus sp.]